MVNGEWMAAARCHYSLLPIRYSPAQAVEGRARANPDTPSTQARIALTMLTNSFRRRAAREQTCENFFPRGVHPFTSER
jgi:hypothetical protein